MTVRVELVCDGGAGPRCQRLPAGMAANGQTMAIVLARLHIAAREVGWVKRRGVGWLCPTCARGVVPLARVA